MLNKLRRIPFFFKHRTYRYVLMFRALLRMLAGFNKNLEFIGIRDQGLNLLTYYKDKAITLYTLADGFYHKREFDQQIEMIRREGFDLSGGFLEIGGNIGSTTVAVCASGLFRNTITFEPEPMNVRMIKANLALNGFLDCVEIVEMAVSDRLGVSSMGLSSSNFGDHRLYAEVQNSEQSVIQVSVTTLDDFFKLSKEKLNELSMIWVDTQGHEGFVLAGAQTILEKRKIPWIVEFWPEGMKQANCYDLFVSNVQMYFKTMIDTRTGCRHSVDDIATLASDRPQFEEFTDLILLP